MLRTIFVFGLIQFETKLEGPSKQKPKNIMIFLKKKRKKKLGLSFQFFEFLAPL